MATKKAPKKASKKAPKKAGAKKKAKKTSKSSKNSKKTTAGQASKTVTKKAAGTKRAPARKGAKAATTKPQKKASPKKKAAAPPARKKAAAPPARKKAAPARTAAAAKKAAPARKAAAKKPVAAKKPATQAAAKAAEGDGTTENRPIRKSSMSAGVLAKIRKQLSDKKRSLLEHLETELSELERPEKRHRADLEEMASDTHDTDSLCEIMDIEASQVDQIDLALGKIESGTYGICEDCSEEIPFARLQALPFAIQCIECKRKSEMSIGSFNVARY